MLIQRNMSLQETPHDQLAQVSSLRQSLSKKWHHWWPDSTNPGRHGGHVLWVLSFPRHLLHWFQSQRVEQKPDARAWNRFEKEPCSPHRFYFSYLWLPWPGALCERVRLPWRCWLTRNCSCCEHKDWGKYSQQDVQEHYWVLAACSLSFPFDIYCRGSHLGSGKQHQLTTLLLYSTV